MKQTIDSLIDAKWVIPIEPNKTCLHNHSVAIDHGKVVATLPSTKAHEQYSARNEIRLPHHVLIPGLINLHTHAAMRLMR